jgi:hypothetical protein
VTCLPRLTCPQRHTLRQAGLSRILARLTALIVEQRITCRQAARLLAAYREQVSL